MKSAVPSPQKAARLTGLKQGTPLQAAAAIRAGAVGNGIIQPGVISSTIGTSGVVLHPWIRSGWIPKAEPRPSVMLSLIPGM